MLVQEWTHSPMEQNPETDPHIDGHLTEDKGDVVRKGQCLQ